MRSFWIIFCQIKFKSTKIRIKSLQNKDVQNLKLLQIIITPNDYHNQPFSILLKKRYRTTLFQIYSNWLNFLIPNSLNKYLIPNYPFLNRLHRFPVVRINEKCRLERRRYTVVLGTRLDLSLTAANHRRKWSETGIHSRVLRALARAEQIVLQEGNPQEV